MEWVEHPLSRPTNSFPFGYTDYKTGSLPRKTKLVQITDGTSNTMLMSEVIMAAADTDFDIRGDMMNDDRPCTQYMTLNLPNTKVSDVTPYCLNNGVNPPCTTTGSANSHKAARSKHTGGVNTLRADGSIGFVRDTIDITTWRALGTMDGREVFTDN